MSELIKRIQKHAVEEGTCWRWIARSQSGTTPMMRWEGKVGSVRRFILDERGTPMKGYLAGTTCKHPLCVNPDHVVRTTRSKLSLEAAANMNADSRISKKMKTALKARERAKLNMEIARAIRQDDRPQRVIAAHYGVGQHTVQDIQAGRTWVDYAARNNPFSQLMR